MPILHKVGRKHIRVRLLVAVLYAFAVAGGLTMIYPFALMMSGSTKSAVDQKEMLIIPGFLSDETLLYRKYIEGLFNERLEMLRMAYDEEVSSFEKIDVPPETNDALVDSYRSFLETLEDSTVFYTVGFLRIFTTRGLHMEVYREFVRRLKEEFGGDIEKANLELGSTFPSWHAVWVDPQIPLERIRKLSTDPLVMRYRALKQDQPHLFRFYFSVEGMYRNMFLKPQYSRKIDLYNKSHETSHTSYTDVPLPRRSPGGSSLERKDWERFVREALHVMWIRADPEAVHAYREFLHAKYLDIDSVNRIYDTDHTEFSDISMPDSAALDGIIESDWTSYIRGWKDPDTGRLHSLPLEFLSIDSLDFRYRDYLRDTYGTIDQFNAAVGAGYSTYEQVRMPQKSHHYREFLSSRNSLRWEFITRNYATVLHFMVLNGRAIYNTLIYCFLAVLTALIVNPMAAYALSRFQLPSTYKVLLFLMATMAFPAMVTQIPVFLILRNLNLLNTFWALILPGLANGFLIFILKGFFDSHPRELYECAALDGANEWVLFWRITMNLSKPVLAFIALMAFTAAYSNFMFALLICQDERMWTLMPTLYQLQQRSHMGQTFASLIIAAAPTFLVFLFAQNIIMRGIVVPVEK